MNDEDEALAEALLASHRLDPHTLIRARTAALESSRSLSEVLLAEGLITPVGLQELSASASGRRQVARCGPYAILEELGRGGVGVVYRAQRPGGPPVALKVLLASAHDHEEIQRLAREALAGQRLRDHPHVVQLLDTGVASGRPYLVLELMAGGSLQDRLKQGPLPIEDALDLGRSLASALSAAHADGIYHRDLKPGNVLFDASGRPALADFGMARARGESNLTATGTFMGTPQYVAPEQARDAKRADARSEVYGLAAILYHALTGRPPIERGGDLTETVRAICEDVPPAARALRPEVPAHVSEAIARALAKDPTDRFPSVAGFAGAFSSAPRRGERARPKPLLPLLALGGVVLGLGLGVGLASALSPALPAQPSATAAKTPTPSPIATPPPAPPTLAPSPKATPPADPHARPDPPTWNGHCLELCYSHGTELGFSNVCLVLRFRVEASEPGRTRLAVGVPLVLSYVATSQDGRLTWFSSNEWRRAHPAAELSLGTEFAMYLSDQGEVHVVGGLQRIRQPYLDQVGTPSFTLVEKLLTEEYFQDLFAKVFQALRPAERRWDMGSYHAPGGRLTWAGIPQGNSVVCLREVRVERIRHKESFRDFAARVGTSVSALIERNHLGAHSVPGAGDLFEIPPTEPSLGEQVPVRVKLGAVPRHVPHARAIGHVESMDTYGFESRQGWRRIRWGSHTAWVPETAIEPREEVHALEVVPASVAVYDRPGPEGTRIGSVYAGQRFERRGRREGWVQLVFRDRGGWVLENTVKRVSSKGR